ncbi:hypothetical protein IWQ62_002875 [Dispira parvispora]|uniref:Uncharacterized protein n=1 Tax=Dispira parvispora TaxID=1520584 RepID=A0A9W8AV79_9FUNG|nr:hypothetical protein IWQ62_002875 [Dispira parvispora]
MSEASVNVNSESATPCETSPATTEVGPPSDLPTSNSIHQTVAMSVVNKNKGYPKSTRGSAAPSHKHHGLENVFTRDKVKTWSTARIQAWNQRHGNPDAFYYRFVDPTEGQSNGGFSKLDHQAFMERLGEWKTRGYRLGSAWGLFSTGVPHKAGYMCSSYYRKLLEKRQLHDDAYQWVDGKLVMVNKQRYSGASVPQPVLSDRWQTTEVQHIASEVDAWIKEFHGTAGGSLSNPSRQRVAKHRLSTEQSTTLSTKCVTGSSASKRPKTTKESTEAVSIPSDPLDSVSSITLKSSVREKFKAPYTIPNAEFKQRMRQLAEIRANRQNKRSIPQHPVSRPPPSETLASTSISPQHTPPSRRSLDKDFVSVTKSQKSTQIDLSRYWKGVKAPETPIPDPIFIRLPNVIPTTWAKPLLSLETQQELAPEATESIYLEVDNLLDLDLSVITEACQANKTIDPAKVPSLASTNQTDQMDSTFEGILVDPPWTFLYEEPLYAHCFDSAMETSTTMGVTVDQVHHLLEEILPSLPKGLVFLWTHKAILPEVVAMMQTLDCRYVENLIWFKKAINNTLVNQPSPYFRCSKETLLLFKRGEGFDIRHQRSADVVIDFARPIKDWIYHDWTGPKPDAVYEMIETLLPNTAYDHDLGRGRLLELWSNRDSARRSGWVHIREPKRGFEEMETNLTPAKFVVDGSELGDVAESYSERVGVSQPVLSLIRQPDLREQSLRATAKVIRGGTLASLVLDRPGEYWLVPRKESLLQRLGLDPNSSESTKLITELLDMV